MIKIEVLKEKDKKQLYSLLCQEFLNFEIVLNSVYNEHVFCVGIIDDEKIVGCVFVHEGYRYLKNQKFYTLEYVVVDKAYRGRGLSKQLLQYVEDIAKKNDIQSLVLTSKSSRTIARNLYTSVGFIGKDTGVFQKELR